MAIQLPYGFVPRGYQIPVYSYLDSGGKRGVLVWHRRAGKDSTMLNYIIKVAHQRVGVYYHLFPTFTEGRRIIWDGRTKEGKRFLDYFPKGLLQGKPNDTEMRIRFRNGSIYQIIGTDNSDTVVGTNPIGCVFSEYSLQNPKAWNLIRPILTENGGWAVFVFTPRGDNHGKEIWDIACSEPGWFHQLLTINDTRREDGSAIVTAEDVEREIREGMDTELAQQEYYCSWVMPRSGSLYGHLLSESEKAGRITNVPYDPKFPVNTWWDIGIKDSTAIWFTQAVGREIRVIDYLENSGVGLSWYAKALLNERPYFYGRHGFPFDASAKELGTGMSIEEQAYSLGIKPVDIVPKLSLEDGISAVRAIIPRCWFDRTKCASGIKALRNYHKEYDDKLMCYKPVPLHDWSSHGSDSFRYFAIGFSESAGQHYQSSAISDWNPIEYNRPGQYQEYAESNWEVF